MHDGSIQCGMINVIGDVTANACIATVDVVLAVAVIVSGVVHVVRVVQEQLQHRVRDSSPLERIRCANSVRMYEERHCDGGTL